MGWWDGLASCVRCSLWQVKQTSVWVARASTLSWLVWFLWQDEQARSADSCWLPPHRARFASFWWQLRHAPLSSLTGTFAFLLNTRSGNEAAGLAWWAVLGPWQLTQVGVRESVTTAWACRLLSGMSSSSWHLTQAADAAASTPAALTVATSPKSPSAMIAIARLIRISSSPRTLGP